MSSVLFFLSLKNTTGSFILPSQKETGLDCNQYFLRLVRTIRMHFTSNQVIDISEAGFLKNWLEEAEDSC